MGCRVLGIERIPELAAAARERLAAVGFGEAVEIRVADGTLGAPDGAPWRRIVVAAAAPRVPDALTAQLADGGRLVIPVGERWEQTLMLVERDGPRLRTTHHGACVFVPLVGEGGFR
jgi:protein-L-isoaspartate(D-aspartate) O-methyltransferase